MNVPYRRTVGLAVLVAVLLVVTAGVIVAAPRGTTYEVTITNLTDGQPLTPPVVALHRPSTGIFTVGEPASFELKEVAENGNLDPLVASLSENRHVADVAVAVAGDPPPLLPGQSVTVQLTESRGGRFLSFAAMLICTNDGFTGVDTVHLPRRPGERIIVHTAGYDAGTEINTEDFADLVPPCPVLTGVDSNVPGTGMSDPALAEDGLVHHHPGIQGTADLDPAIHGWTDPVAEIEIVRLD